ncbi:MAG TPA: hypothetical protein VGK20_07455 [Candidatus Binatia bacterium]|jgi:hypothetical protein
MGRSHLIKFHRSQDHLRELGARITDWKQGAGKTLFGEPDSEDPGYQIFYFQNDPIPAAALSPVIGDVVQNLRASLDHLFFELAAAFSGRLTKKQEEIAKFPIHRSEGEFREGAADVLGLVGSEAGEIIHRLQPCYTRPDKNPEWDLLWQLHELAVADQRETLPVVGSVVGRWSLEAIVPADFDPAGGWFRTGIPPKGRAPIARLPLLPEGTEDDVIRKVTSSLDVALANPPSPPAGDPIYEVLVDISQYVRSRVFKVLEPLLPPSSSAR